MTIIYKILYFYKKKFLARDDVDNRPYFCTIKPFNDYQKIHEIYLDVTHCKQIQLNLNKSNNLGEA